MKVTLPTYQLAPNPLPKSTWYRNIRNYVTREVWHQIQGGIFQRDNYKCRACGAKGELHCHEDWSLNFETKTQLLINLITLCEICHSVVHIGRTIKLGRDRYKKALLRYSQIAGITPRQASLNIVRALQQPAQGAWHVDFGSYKYYIRRPDDDIRLHFTKKISTTKPGMASSSLKSRGKRRP